MLITFHYMSVRLISGSSWLTLICNVKIARSKILKNIKTRVGKNASVIITKCIKTR